MLRATINIASNIIITFPQNSRKSYFHYLQSMLNFRKKVSSKYVDVLYKHKVWSSAKVINIISGLFLWIRAWLL